MMMILQFWGDVLIRDQILRMFPKRGGNISRSHRPFFTADILARHEMKPAGGVHNPTLLRFISQVLSVLRDVKASLVCFDKSDIWDWTLNIQNHFL